jgi:cytochrome c-type biogenesis protein CcmH
VKRWAPLLAACIIAVIALAIGARPQGKQTPEQRADALASRIKCPTCQGLSVKQSSTGASAAIREEISRQVALGRTDEQVVQFISSRYGDELLINPPATGAGAVVWVAPIAFVVLAFAGLAVALRRWSSAARRTPEPEDLDAVARARLAARS